MTKTDFIKQTLPVAEKNIDHTLQLLQEDCTIPFIARYRKDRTGNLDEIQIEQISKLSKQYDEIVKRKESILKSIEEQDALTAELQSKIEASFDLQYLEDLYLPYKKKKKTKADTARALGLEPLAKIIMAQNASDISGTASRYLSENVTSEEEALQGARDIIAEWMNEHLFIRKQLRRLFQYKAEISSKVVKSKKDEEAAQKFSQYFDWKEGLSRIPSHRLLAMLRAEAEGFIKFGIDIDKDEAVQIIEKAILKSNNECATQIKLAAKDAYKRLLEPAISNEVLQEAKLKADTKAIEVFAENLRQLLLASPLGEKRILAIDPGYRTGCKVVCLDEKGDLLHNENIYPHAPQNETGTAMKKIRSMVNAYNIEAISIGNGTASRETEFFIKKIAFDRPLQVFVVSEAGASVYSASKIAREEFPGYDVTVRGAVSIGRRLSDPLAELVKIDPKSIGVGQYQHDVDQTLLKEELDSTVMRCVNSVGINLNTASKSLLSYVSGIGEKMAENIVTFRSENGPFTNRKALKNVPRLGEKAFQQAAGFLRIRESENPLDNSSVHPEAYPVIEKMAKDLGIPLSSLIGNKEKIAQIKPENYANATTGILGIQDILKELEKPGLDPRKAAKVFEFDKNIRKLEDVKTDMVLPGIVNNITAFGCFVDIGIKESGLVHISQLKDGFVSDVNEVVKLHQHVQVKVVEIDTQRKRIQLSMIL
ncbi:RNA-binding transcriptional accessory protein [Elizabethkingia meningoseptica]|uniref:Tex family protein n=1 Tax=Elizabethkingia meningoseptica TaxID=238 RepID=UPI000332CDB2|nr:Tex family protein [Elizabethkingia meningoseptica]AQX05626.1 RNA-binding transcriptional accessory protein [Elizabethkingia meningoseptica]AQX47670.1 RNA-binding transcriptional accessory protein [Elizabethkingia meningoseptica]EOR29650.1 RNA binding protein with S1 RNA-binding domain [Elizabethkingia meningoseptica ATCC 13253 = NBRC 12535]KUY24443.1 RNA-binding transcriptional accessory protein [Elizabethkingia meningoseptica]OPB67734.1 RNA-binding transcriptional accessory protein [Eliza